jgi:CRISPR-associated endonuclease/helicase Cas3
MTTLRLAQVEGERLVPWCSDPDPHRAWALSEVTVRRTRVAGVPEPPFSLRAAASVARGGWTRHDEHKLLLPLHEQARGLWHSRVLDLKGELQGVTYSRSEGFSLGESH